MQQTEVRLCSSPEFLFVRFDCVDTDIWATMTERDDLLYEEEVVEVFLAPGPGVPSEYAELVVNPDGVLYDAWIRFDVDSQKISVDRSWDCANVIVESTRDDGAGTWSVALAVPWASLTTSDAGSPSSSRPGVARANFYRIDRPRDGSPPEFSCWSPTLTDPADFHRPARFGTLELGGHEE